MPTLGVNIAIINEKRRILLTEREDFEVWCLPGGGVDFGESTVEAAVREAEEETGLKIEITRLVGVYSRPLWLKDSDHTILFAARTARGRLIINPKEVIGLGFFETDNLPKSIIWWQERQIRDAVSGVSGVSWKQDAKFSKKKSISRQKLYQMRDQSGLPRQEFFSQYFKKPEFDSEKIELAGRAPEKNMKCENPQLNHKIPYLNERAKLFSSKDHLKDAVFQRQ